jgi:hypothetical protein
MPLTELKSIHKPLLLLLLFLLTASFLPSPATPDVRNLIGWAANAHRLGIVKGFAANNADYPPLSTPILLAAVRALHPLGVSPFEAIKLSIMLFLLASSLAFWLWTRDFWSTALLHVSLLLDSVALGYIDIYFAPTLIASLWALRARRLVWSTVFFTIACFTKWQPLILAPFIVFYILRIVPDPQWKLRGFGRVLREVVMPALVIGIGLLLVYGVLPMSSSLQKALSHNFLSGNALNFNWVLTHSLRVFAPEAYGGLVAGRADFIVVRSVGETLFSRVLFFSAYVTTLVAFCRGERTFEDLLRFSLIGYLAYYVFNIGVHENHLFIPVVIVVILFWLNRGYVGLAATVILMSNINLLVFYGVDGIGFYRVVGETLDMALLFAVYNTSFFVVLWASNVFVNEAPKAGQPPRAGDFAARRSQSG